MIIRNKHIILTIALTFFVGIFTTYAQQVPLYSQYMMSKFLLNPAVAGSEGYTAFSLVSRQQWLGFEGSPMTNALVGQMRLGRNSFISKGASVKRKRRISKRSGKVGLGGYLYNDQTGPKNITGLQLTYAYHMTLRNSQISLGLSLNSFQYGMKNLDLYEQDDLADGRLSTYIPDANVGVYYSDNHMYAGFSADQLLQSAIQFGNSEVVVDPTMYRNYYLMGGYFYEINRQMLMEASTLIKMTQQAQSQFELGAKVYYRKNYWGGLAWRTGGNWGSVILMGGVKLDKVYLGYAFDWSFNKMSNYGSHELVASLKLGTGSKRYKWMNRY